MLTWEFEVVRDRDRIMQPDYQQKWGRLVRESHCSHVFFHPTMAKAWTDTYLPLRRLEPIYIWARDDDGNEAFLPLELWRRNWKSAFIKSIVPVGYSDYDYHDPLFLKEPTANASEAYWRGVYEILGNIKADEIILDGLHERNVRDRSQWREQDICPFLSLENIHNDEELMRFFKTGLRGDLRRQMRRLNELGELQMKEYHSRKEIEATFSDFIAAHTLRWPKSYKAPGFHRNLCTDGMLATVTHFSSLNVDGTPIAWHLGFQWNGVYYYYMPAGNPEFMNYSPVKVHLYFLLKRAVELGLDKYDHLRGEETYKSGWSNGHEYLYSQERVSGNPVSRLKINCLRTAKRMLR